MKTIKFIMLTSLLVFGLLTQAHAAIAIIVNPDNNTQFDERTVRQIFLGQIKTFPDGSEARAYDNLGNDALRSAFITQVLRRNESTMNAYWARMIFTAKATPPQELPNSASVKKTVAENKNAIGYIEADKIDSSVRVIVTIE